MKNRRKAISGLCPGSDGKVSKIHFNVKNDRIFQASSKGEKFGNYWVFPALVNIHDHLCCSWFRATRGGPYPDSVAWIKAEEKEPLRKLRKATPIEERTRLGFIKNILSGVGTVLDHLPFFAKENLAKEYETSFLRVISNYRAEGVWRSRILPLEFHSWGEGVEAELAATGHKCPFVIHLAEGTNDESRVEFQGLHGLGGITPNTIIVHGVALSSSNLAIMAENKTGLVWCPCSNKTILAAHAPIREALAGGVIVALGSDSNLSGSAHLLSEARWARLEFQRFYQEELPLPILWNMITHNPASMLGLNGLVGSLEPGSSADFFFLKRRGDNPLQDLFSSHTGHIGAIVHRGKVIAGNPEIFERTGLPLLPLEPWKFLEAPLFLPLGTGALIESLETQIGMKLRLAFLPPCLKKM